MKDPEVMPVLLRLSSGTNLILALIVFLVQCVILTSYKHLSGVYSYDSGVGIWAAVLLASNGFGLLLNLKRKFLCSPSIMYKTTLFFGVATFMGGLVLIGVSVATLYGPLSQLNTEAPPVNTTSKTARLDEDVSSLKALESVLLGCGIVSTIVNPLSVIFLRLDYKTQRLETILHQRL